ncbi:MAG: hypothetical protein HKN75_02460, partial [Bacteroidia bacterium]|nr:hypothetical protein [Bacteroidia bacterium]
ITIILYILFCAGFLQAQDYSTGIGFRTGVAHGLTVKHFIDEKAAIEAMLSTRWKGITITGLYETHAPVWDTPRLNWYIGGGGHVAFYDYEYDEREHMKKNPCVDDYDDHALIGIDGIVGIEYTFKQLPLNFGFDWKPTFDLVECNDFRADEVSLFVRFGIK